MLRIALYIVLKMSWEDCQRIAKPRQEVQLFVFCSKSLCITECMEKLILPALNLTVLFHRNANTSSNVTNFNIEKL